MEASIDHIGIIIAYVAPGVIAILGAIHASETLRSWFHPRQQVGEQQAGPTVAFL